MSIWYQSLMIVVWITYLFGNWEPGTRWPPSVSFASSSLYPLSPAQTTKCMLLPCLKTYTGPFPRVMVWNLRPFITWHWNGTPLIGTWIHGLFIRITQPSFWTNSHICTRLLEKPQLWLCTFVGKVMSLSMFVIAFVCAFCHKCDYSHWNTLTPKWNILCANKQWFVAILEKNWLPCSTGDNIAVSQVASS